MAGAGRKERGRETLTSEKETILDQCKRDQGMSGVLKGRKEFKERGRQCRVRSPRTPASKGSKEGIMRPLF